MPRRCRDCGGTGVDPKGPKDASAYMGPGSCKRCAGTGSERMTSHAATHDTTELRKHVQRSHKDIDSGQAWEPMWWNHHNEHMARDALGPLPKHVHNWEGSGAR